MLQWSVRRSVIRNARDRLLRTCVLIFLRESLIPRIIPVTELHICVAENIESVFIHWVIKSGGKVVVHALPDCHKLHSGNQAHIVLDCKRMLQ